MVRRPKHLKVCRTEDDAMPSMDARPRIIEFVDQMRRKEFVASLAALYHAQQRSGCGVQRIARHGQGQWIARLVGGKRAVKSC